VPFPFRITDVGHILALFCIARYVSYINAQRIEEQIMNLCHADPTLGNSLEIAGGPALARKSQRRHERCYRV